MIDGRNRLRKRLRKKSWGGEKRKGRGEGKGRRCHTGLHLKLFWMCHQMRRGNPFVYVEGRSIIILISGICINVMCFGYEI